MATATDFAMKVLGRTAKNLANVPLSEYAYSAAGGAAGFGAFGAAGAFLNGGDAWEEAKAGVWRGAWMGAGFRAVKSAPFKEYKGTRTVSEAYGAYKENGARMSNQVKTLMQNAQMDGMARGANGLG